MPTAPPTHVLSAGTWTIDPGHADVSFTGRHLGLTKVRGSFPGVSGTLVIPERLTDSRVTVEIDMASVYTGNSDRDDHLRSSDLFDIAAHPTATFTSTAVTIDGSSGTLTGNLTLKGVTRPVTFDVAFIGAATDPWDNERAVFSAVTRINREDWGVTWNMAMEAGGLLVGKQITLDIELELVRSAASD